MKKAINTAVKIKQPKSLKKSCSLTIVGSGIKFVSHLTTEARVYIEQSERVLYLVNEPAMKEWIVKTNPKAESLDELYVKHHLRLHCYRAITKYILEVLYQRNHVCVVLYGHPAVFAQPGLDAVIKAKKEGYDARILPGISAEDCLFADCLIDPGTFGCQSFEATDFIIRQKQYDPNSYLVLWQVGSIGALDHPRNHDNSKGINLLKNVLEKKYSLEHEVILYEASQYPHFDPRIDKTTLALLPQAKITSLTTLCIPPAAKTPIDHEMLKLLNIDIEDLK
jgi:tetrapyrrole methylase family protein/MazG family protein